MTRWILRLAGLSAVIGLGWFGVIWAQQKFSHDAPLPDLSKDPVNVSADGLLSGTYRRAATTNHTEETAPSYRDNQTSADAARMTSADSAPADPFHTAGASADAQASHGASGSAYSYNKGAQSSYASGSSANDRYSDRGRYTNTEPRTLDADPTAQPVATQSSGYYGATQRDATQAASAAQISTGIEQTTGSRGDISSTATGVSSNDTDVAGRDPAAVALVARANALRRDSQQVSAVAAATGTIEPADDARGATSSATPTSSADQYGSSRASSNDLQRTSPPVDPRSLSDARSLVEPPKNDSGIYSSGIGGNSAATVSPMQSQTGGYQMAGPTSPIANLGNGTRSVPATVADSAAAANVEGLGRPGDKKLEGAQTPSVTIEKIAPPEIQVGKAAKFQIVVRNTGPVVAENVEVTDVIPQGTQLVSTNPKTSAGARGQIVWNAGDLKPGENSTLEVELMPVAEGEIGSTATVQFRSAASMRTVATKPDLVLELTAPKQVLIGQSATVHLKLSNPGTGAASKVMLSARIPANLQHAAGNELEYEIGQFKPGDSRDLELVLRAAAAGPCALTLVAQGEANLRTEQTANIEIIAPRLELKVAGPGLRFLDKQAKYTVSVSNPGTAPAHDITLTTRLPKGMQFVEASDSGRYDVATNAVMWGLDELPAGQTGSVTLTALAKETGDQKLRGEVKAASGLSDAAEQLTVVEGVANVTFTVANVDDPVEVGGQATYEIHVVNQGSKAANHLQVAAVLPDGMKPVSAEGPAKYATSGQQTVFEPLARLAPKADITYKVVGQCLAPGDLRVMVQLKTDEMERPITKEESTRVYKD
jgi:uncharacterized repeat protein (TIGR01451 family)